MWYRKGSGVGTLWRARVRTCDRRGKKDQDMNGGASGCPCMIWQLVISYQEEGKSVGKVEHRLGGPGSRPYFHGYWYIIVFCLFEHCTNIASCKCGACLYDMFIRYPTSIAPS